MSLLLEVITPEKVILKEEVDEIVVQTTTGEITILPNHEDLLTKLKEGEMLIKKHGKITYFALTGGFLEVSQNKVNILADYAIRAEDIEIAKAEEAKERAQKKLKEHQEEKEFIVADAELKKAILELRVARKIKTRSS